MQRWCVQERKPEVPPSFILLFCIIYITVSLKLHKESQKLPFWNLRVWFECVYWLKKPYDHLKIYIFYWLCYYTCPFFPLPFISLSRVPYLPLSFPHLSSCPWVIHISSLASPFPILLLTSPSILYLLFMLLILYTFTSLSPNSPLITLHVISISVNLFLF